MVKNLVLLFVLMAFVPLSAGAADTTLQQVADALG
jgi:hypothetical protein